MMERTTPALSFNPDKNYEKWRDDVREKLISLAGIDRIAEKAYKTVEGIYAAAGSPDNCRLVVTPKGHYWCEDIVWDVIDEECKKLGW